MNELIREINSRLKDAQINPPADIQRMLERKGAKNQNFTINVYAQGDTNAMAYFMFILYTYAKEEKGDLETLKNLASDFLSFQGNRFKEYYKMWDSLKVSMDSALAFKDIRTNEEFCQLARAVQSYFGQLAYWIDLVIPWEELGQAHTRIMQEHNGLPYKV